MGHTKTKEFMYCLKRYAFDSLVEMLQFMLNLNIIAIQSTKTFCEPLPQDPKGNFKFCVGSITTNGTRKKTALRPRMCNERLLFLVDILPLNFNLWSYFNISDTRSLQLSFFMNKRLLNVIISFVSCLNDSTSKMILSFVCMFLSDIVL